MWHMKLSHLCKLTHSLSYFNPDRFTCINNYTPKILGCFQPIVGFNFSQSYNTSIFIIKKHSIAQNVPFIRARSFIFSASHWHAGKRHGERSAPWTAAAVRTRQTGIHGISHRRSAQERARHRDVCKWIILIGRERALETRAVCWCARQNVHFEDESEGSSISIPIALRSTASTAPTDYPMCTPCE